MPIRPLSEALSKHKNKMVRTEENIVAKSVRITKSMAELAMN
jgi:hypothetical protein